MSWDRYKKAAERGPFSIGIMIILLIVGLSIMGGVIGYSKGWFEEAGKVAQEEFGPKAAMEKYEWFIEQVNAIEKMDVDITLYTRRLNNVEEEFKSYGTDKSKWPPHIQISYNQRRQEAEDDVTAIVAQRNNLVKDYNAASSKFNWEPFKTEPNKPIVSFNTLTY